MKNKLEDELFLQKIIQPSSYLSTSPNTIYLAKVTKTLVKDK